MTVGSSHGKNGPPAAYKFSVSSGLDLLVWQCFRAITWGVGIPWTVNRLRLGPCSAIAIKSTTAEGQSHLAVDSSALLALLVTSFKRIKARL
jgi:hypothetical protein